MTAIHRLSVLPLSLLAAGASAMVAIPSAGDAGDRRDVRIEVSADGHETAILDGAANSGTVTAIGNRVPYGDAPDWDNDLRRQIGGLQVADMNGDGLPDVVAGLYQSNSFPPYESWHNTIYFNIGGELEASPSWISDDEVSTGDIQVGDIDGDGHLDVFSANGGFAMAPSVIYFGGEDGPSTSPGWSSTEPGNAWNNAALLVDLDGDGWLDVVTANQGNSQQDPFRPMFVFRNTDGSLATTPSWQSAESSIQNFLDAGDYDGNGTLDIAVSKWVNWETGIYENVGGTLQTSPAWTTGLDDSDRGVAWSDIDQDGHLDLVVGEDPTVLYANDGDDLAVAWQADAPYFGHQDLLVADITGDGYDDVIEVHFANGHVNIYLNNAGVLDTEPSWTFDSPGVGTAVAVGDINGNGFPDLVVGNSGDPSIYVFYHQGAPASCQGDLSGDGAIDGSDLALLLADWGQCGDPGDCPADLDGSGTVDGADLAAMLAAWGPCD